MKDSLRAVQVQLSETSNLYIAQGDKLRETRRSRLEIDQENTTLKTSLSRTKVLHVCMFYVCIHVFHNMSCVRVP